MPVLDRVLLHAATAPGRVAIQVDGAALNYAELAARALSVHGALTGMPGREPGRFGLPHNGRLVATSLGNDLRFPEVFLGASAHPHAVAVLDPKWPESQVHEVLRRLAPDALVTADATSPAALAARACGIPVRVAGEIMSEREPAIQADGLSVELGDDAPFLIGFTSGTTSLPKAYRRTRATWRAAHSRSCGGTRRR